MLRNKRHTKGFMDSSDTRVVSSIEKNSNRIPYCKNCEYCNRIFYAKRNTAKYCSNSCRQKEYLSYKRFHQAYYQDPNKGKKIPPGTIPSFNMPEDELVFKGDLVNLYSKLSDYISDVQLIDEKDRIVVLKPFSKTKLWVLVPRRLTP